MLFCRATTLPHVLDRICLCVSRQESVADSVAKHDAHDVAYLQSRPVLQFVIATSQFGEPVFDDDRLHFSDRSISPTRKNPPLEIAAISLDCGMRLRGSSLLLIHIEFSCNVVHDKVSKGHPQNRSPWSCAVDVDPKRVGSPLSGCLGAVLENGSNGSIVFLP